MSGEEPNVTGYCMTCGHEIDIPAEVAWPQACPYCHVAPFSVSSEKPKRWPDDFRGFGIHVKW